MSSLTLSVSVVVLVGLMVALAAGETPSARPAADAGSSPLSQTEDSTTEDGTTEEGTEEPGAPAVELSNIEQLLAQLLPAGEGSALPSGQRVVLSRDPFNPVVPQTAADGDGSDGDGTDGDGTDGDGTDGDGTDGDGTDGDGTDGDGTDEDSCTGDEAERVCDDDRGTFVVTVDSFPEDGTVLVTVNGTTYTVGVDDGFAEHFRVEAINDPCVTLLFGDEAFSICAGSTVLK